jgi:lipoate-protein ligase A
MYVKDNDTIKLSKNEYCQVGFEAYDILVNCTKIGGNAQRRTKLAIFQHGSIPVKCTKIEKLKNEIGSTLEDFNINLDFEEVSKKIIESFKKSFNVELVFSDLTKEENEKKEILLKEKYDYSNN